MQGLPHCLGRSSFPKVYIDALRRGIGMHHEGLPASFRKTVRGVRQDVGRRRVLLLLG